MEDSEKSAQNAPAALNPKQEAFCQEYLKDLNATQAAIRAGYSKDSARIQASKMLAKGNIAARVQELMNVRAERTGIDADFVLGTIVETINRCRQAEEVMEFDHTSKQMVPTGEWQFEHSGVLKGCELLGKHLALFTEKHEHSGPAGGPIAVQSLTDEQLDARLAALLGQSKKEPGSEPA